MPTVAAMSPPKDETATAAISGSPSGVTSSRRKRFPMFSSLSLGNNKDKTSTTASGGSASPRTGSSTKGIVLGSHAPMVSPAGARDPKVRRGSLPIFDRIPALKESSGSTMAGTNTGAAAVASTAAETTDGTEIKAGGGPEGLKAELERREPPKRRHSASATQIAAISARAFGGADAAAYDSDSSAWLDSDDED